MSTVMKGAAAAVVALLAACVDGRREHVKVHEMLDKYDGIEAGADMEDTLKDLYDTFSTRSSGTAAQSIYNNVKRVSRSPNYGDGSSINKEGWDLLMTQVLQPKAGLETTALNEAWLYLSESGKLTAHMAAQKISSGQMPKKRMDVLKSVYEKVAGGLGNQLTEDQLTCTSSPAGLISAMGGAPVNFDKFKDYYNGLGMFLASDELFELMVVNAWHHMEGKYEKINTANLRVRCYPGVKTAENGDYIALKDDCQQEGSIKQAVNEQQGTHYTECKRHE